MYSVNFDILLKDCLFVPKRKKNIIDKFNVYTR